MWLDKHGWVPADIIATDPTYNSVVIPIWAPSKPKRGYHHLTNWGTCSMFCIIGEKKMSPFYDADGNVTMKETLDLGLTIDERLADGYYYPSRHAAAEIPAGASRRTGKALKGGSTI